MKKTNALLIAINNSPIWANNVIEAFGDKHNLRIYNADLPLAEQFKDIEMVIDNGVFHDRTIIDAADGVKLWQVLSTGIDHTDVDHIKSKGIVVANCPGQLSGSSLAECAMMFILMLTRHFHDLADDFQNKILWSTFGRSLDGLSLGLIGFGASGRELAKRAKVFGLKIKVIEVGDIPEDVLHEIKPDFVGGPDDMDKVIAESDILSLHLPLIKETRHIIDARRLALMKPDAYLINVARGALVDEDALYKMLLEGKLGGAGLDAFSDEPPNPEREVYKLHNVICTPHIAGVSNGIARLRAHHALKNADNFAQGLEAISQV